MAVGHTLLVIVYHVLRRREAYRELGADYYDRLQPERLTAQPNSSLPGDAVAYAWRRW